MEAVCPIDSQFADEISALLKPPMPHQVQEYFDQLTTTREIRGLKVRQNGEHGKGVYADVDFEEGDLVLKDQMLAGSQHSSNKIDCLVCSFCFCFIGSIELQIGRKLYLQDLGVSTNNECERKPFSHIPKETCQIDSSDGEDDSYVVDHRSSKEYGSSSSKYRTPLPKEIVESLMNGELVLPFSKQFPLPSVISCPGGCRESYYCSKLCAEADWDLFHSLLCTGARSKSLNKEALLKFIQHANETNDIFLLAAKVVSFTILRYKKSKTANLEKEGKCTTDSCNLSLLLEAWKPISMGYKRRWWECIALPDDVDCHEETSFRMQIKELAFMKEAEITTRPVLDALGDDYSVCCEGTAFFPLQSCMNHSCHPNAKAFKREEDRDGQATIIALRPISKGEEVTISYIEEDLPFEERQALLADYGFRCKCPKCLEEEL
ncbi:hypothetical protein CsSME_00027085 [Camellia sinensis var. sinensis]